MPAWIAVAGLSAALVATAAEGIRWEPLGEPGGGGCFVSVAVSPHDARHVVAGGDMLGTGMSCDGGAAWTPGCGLATYEMAAVTFHPERTNEVWIGSCSGPYRSLDGGRTWQTRRRGMPEPCRGRYSAMVEKVLFDPAQPSHMLAFGGSSRRWGRCKAFGAVWSSADGGESWRRTGTISTNGFTAAAMQGDNIVKAFWGVDGTVHLVADRAGWFRSQDRGLSWTRCTPKGIAGDIAGVTAHPKDPAVFWLTTRAGAIGAGGRRAPGRIYRSVDGGRAFTPCDAGLEAVSDANANLVSHFSDVAVSAADPSLLYVSDLSWRHSGIWRSRDGGSSWRKVCGRKDVATALFAGLSMRLAVSPTDARTAFAWNTEFILRTTDGGETWRDVTSVCPDPARPAHWRGCGWNGWCARNVAFNPYRKGQCIVQGMDACHGWISDDGLKTWHYARGAVGAWTGGQAVAFARDGHIYITTGQRNANAGVLVSDDWGATWRTCSGAACGLPSPKEGSFGFVWADPDEGRRAFVLIGGARYVTEDGGRSWRRRNANLPKGNVVADTLTKGRFFVKTDEGILETDDWAAFRNLGLDGKSEGGICCDAKGRILVCRGRVGEKRGLWRYDRATARWTRLLEEPLARACAVNPHDPARLLLLTADQPYHDFAGGNGVFFSRDDGATWRAENEGLPMRRLWCCAFDPFAPDTAVAGMGGGGFVRAQLPK